MLEGKTVIKRAINSINRSLLRKHLYLKKPATVSLNTKMFNIY